MIPAQIFQLVAHDRLRRQWPALLAMALGLFTVGTDYLYASWHRTGFYLSESLLFSSFWLCFLPILHFLRSTRRHAPSVSQQVLIALLATGCHLLIYPALVWILSGLLYHHRFAYGQTFQFGCTEHIMKAILVYGLAFRFYPKGTLSAGREPLDTQQETGTSRPHRTSILVSGGVNSKSLVALEEVVYISARTPYISIHLSAKKYLHGGTLKSLEKELDPAVFVRTHKSHIVNIHFVVSCRSRLNGDYDLVLSEGTVLRMSRHYAPGFRERFDALQRVKPK